MSVRTFALLCLPALGYATPSTTLLGVVTEQADRRCEAGRDVWVNPHLEVGFVRVVKGADLLRPNLGRAVVAEGASVSPPPKPPEKVYAPLECPEYQMRSGSLPTSCAK